MSDPVISYKWDFGDGYTSSEIAPTHIYSAPGVYTVTLTLILQSGYELETIKELYITATEFNYGGSFDVSNTDLCYRVAVIPRQGIGISKFTGTAWLFPTAYTGAFKGIDTGGKSVSIVCDNRTGKFYQVGVPELWTDKTANDVGTEIASKVKLKERTAVAGEYQQIEHVESHVHIRPWKETNRDASGFDSDGFRDGHEVSLQFYENGEPTTPATVLENLDRYGDYVARIRLEARRIQEEYLFAAAAWRIIKTQELYMPIDKAAGPAFDYPQEQEWQDEFNSPVLWLSRDRLRPILNRATGINFGGSYDSLVTGPDSQSNSAVYIAAGDSLTYSMLTPLSEDFTISFWVRTFQTPITILTFATGTMSIGITELGGVYTLTFGDGIYDIQAELSYTATGWVHIAITRSGTTFSMYEDGSLLHSETLEGKIPDYGGSLLILDSMTAYLFDLIFLNSAVSANALNYYYEQITDNGEQCPFLPILR